MIVPLGAWISQLSGLGSFVQIMTRFLLCFCVLIVPTFLMGGTLAVIGRHVIVSDGLFAKNAAGLYGVNTVGSFRRCFSIGFFPDQAFRTQRQSGGGCYSELLCGDSCRFGKFLRKKHDMSRETSP